MMMMMMMMTMMILQVSMLTGQVAELQKSLSSLQEETDSTITKLRAELHDKATIVETLQQQIRMKMFMNLTTQKNPMMAALADLQGGVLSMAIFIRAPRWFLTVEALAFFVRVRMQHRNSFCNPSLPVFAEFFAVWKSISHILDYCLLIRSIYWKGCSIKHKIYLHSHSTHF